MNFYKHHIGDYDADTAHLSWVEDAAYRRLLCLYYRREQPVPADISQACRLIRAASKHERDAVETVLSEFFTESPDGWRHKRCDEEIESAASKASANRSNGKAGGRPRKNQSEPEPTQQANANPQETQSVSTGFIRAGGTNSQTPDSRLQTPEEDPPASRVPPASAGTATARGTRLDKGWEPGESGLAFAEQQGLRNGRAAAELDRFRDYWAAQPGQKGVKADWQATWRNWVRKALESPATHGGSKPDSAWRGAI